MQQSSRDCCGISEHDAPGGLTLEQLVAIAEANRLEPIELHRTKGSSEEKCKKLAAQLEKHIDKLLADGNLALSLVSWDPESSDEDEKLACSRLSSLFVLYEPYYWW